ncbi:uncharacterized protein METZ01_LOCUS181267, partial [marine metagenome]
SRHSWSFRIPSRISSLLILPESSMAINTSSVISSSASSPSTASTTSGMPAPSLFSLDSANRLS